MVIFNDKQWQINVSTTSKHLRFVIEDDQTEVEIPLQHELIIGRAGDDEQPVDFDLSPYGAYRKGVSRQHIRLETRNGKWFITDLDSNNGTWLNDLRIYPLAAYEVKNGSELRLSDLRLSIFFQ